MENWKFTQLFNICENMSLLYSVNQPISTKMLNFRFSIMKKLWDLAQENLVNIQGNYGGLDQYLCVSAIP